MAELAQRAAAYFTGYVSENSRAYPLLDLDWQNIAAALHWAEQNQAWDSLYHGVEGLTAVNLGVVGFLDARGYWREAAGWLAKVLDSPAVAAGTLAQARTHFKLAAFAYRQADLSAAEDHLQQSVALLEPLPDSEAAGLLLPRVCELMSQLTFERGQVQDALAWSDRGIAALQSLDSAAANQEGGYLQIRRAAILARTGELEAALAATENGLSLLPPEPTPAKVNGLMILGNILFYQGDIEGALAHWQENISQAQALGDNRRLANLWQNIGAAETNRGHIARAVEPKEKALALYHRMGDVAGAATIHSNLGEDYMLLRDYETAETHLTAALETAASHQLSQVELFALVNQVRWQLDNGQLAAAEVALSRAGTLCQQLELAQQQAEITRLQAELAYRQGDHALALAGADEALTLSTNPKEQGLGWRLKGDVWRALAEPAQAEEAYQQSRSILADHNPFECARTLLAWGRHYTGIEAGEKAESLLKTALSTFERLQMPRYATEIRTAMGWDEDELAPERDETAAPEYPDDRLQPPLASATRFLRRELIATGGHGEVYRGQDTETGRQVVIKRLRPELADALRTYPPPGRHPPRLEAGQCAAAARPRPATALNHLPADFALDKMSAPYDSWMGEVQLSSQHANNLAASATDPFSLDWTSQEGEYSYSVAWGDVDGDGDLDLVVGNHSQNRLYVNEGDALESWGSWASAESDVTFSVAWGDVDGDGDIDLAVGNGQTTIGGGQVNRIYRNDGGALASNAAYSFAEVENSRSVAWGDYNGDGKPDLAVGNYGQTNRLYRNDSAGGVITMTLALTSTEQDDTRSIVWGDYDSDGDLDLFAANHQLFVGRPNRLYRNDGIMLTDTAVWSSVEADISVSAAWGDVDGDGDTLTWPLVIMVLIAYTATMAAH